MKNLSLILNIVLLLAVAYLFVDKFSSKTSKPAQAAQAAGAGADPLNIVYINVDSLRAKSTAYQAVKTSVEKKSADAEASLRAKERAFQKDLEAYQREYQTGTLTPKKAQEIEEGLAKKQQAFAEQQERVSKELGAEADAFDAEFIGDLKKIVDSLKTTAGYDFVLIHGGMVSPMLTADESHDITTDVVELLNAKVKASETGGQ